MVTVVLLVAMRLAIGWHFFYEGVWKIRRGDEFSAVPFLTMAKGPAAPLFYAMVYDLEGEERLKVQDSVTADRLVAAWKKARDDSEKRYRANLEKANLEEANVDQAVREFRKATRPIFWAYHDRLQAYLEDNEQQIAAYFAAEEKQSPEKLKTWLTKIGTIEKDYFGALRDYGREDELADNAIRRSTQATVPAVENLDAIDQLLKDNTKDNVDGTQVLDVTIRNPDGEEILHVGPAIKGKVFLAMWDDLRRDSVRKYGLTEEQQVKALAVYREYAAGLRQYLNTHLEEIAAYLGSLSRFRDEKPAGNDAAEFQKQRAWDRQQELRREVQTWLDDIRRMESAYRWSLWQILSDEQKAMGGLPVATTRADLLNFAVTWGLTAIGLCLMVGFCTRLAALGGAAFLVSVLMTQPPWPTVYPAAPEVVGHALLVDKNFVEMVALLVLASTAVGRWGGLDHFVYRYIGEPILNRLQKVESPRQKQKETGKSDEPNA